MSVIVPLRGGARQALRCFEALAALPPEPEFEVIVVDDASAGLDPLLERLGGDVTVVRSERRLGFAGAAALGATRANGQLLALIRDAAEVGHGWLAPLVEAMKDPGLRVATSACEHPAAAKALAIRRADAATLESISSLPEDLQAAALCMALGGRAGVIEASELRADAPVSARRAPGEEPELTIVIPTLDAASERVRECIATLQAATDAPHEIVIVDNGAPPQGFTAPVNAGLRAARGRYMVVMNDDVEVLPGWWPPLRDALDAGAAVTFPLTVEGAVRRDFAAWCFALTSDTVDEFEHAPGEFLDPGLVVWFQDTDLHSRLRAAGRPPLLVEQSRIRHGHSETVASEDPELKAWIAERIARDREAFLAKHPDANLQPVAFA